MGSYTADNLILCVPLCSLCLCGERNNINYEQQNKG